MKIDYLAPDELKPYTNNPRNISAKAIKAVKDSIDRYGFRQPIVADKDNIVVVGHTRLEAAKELGIQKVPVVKTHDLSPDLVQEYRLVDNKTSELSLWDEDLLSTEMMGLDFGDLADIWIDDDMSRFDFDELPDDDDERAPLQAIIQYNIVFDDEEQQAVWHGFLRMLKDSYDDETIAARLIRFIHENGEI